MLSCSGKRQPSKAERPLWGRDTAASYDDLLVDLLKCHEQISASIKGCSGKRRPSKAERPLCGRDTAISHHILFVCFEVFHLTSKFEPQSSER